MRHLLLLVWLILLVSFQSLAQLSYKQGISTIGIKPSASLVTLGFPQSIRSVDGYGQQPMANFPYPFFSLPANFRVNKQGSTEVYGLVGSFDLGVNYSKLLKNNHIFKAEIGIHYSQSPHSYSLDSPYQFFIKNKQAASWHNTIATTGYSVGIMYTSASKGRRGLGEMRNYIELGARTLNLYSKSAKDNDSWVFNGQGFSIESHITQPKSNMITLELGKTFWRPADDMRSLSFGIRIGIPFDKMVENTIIGYQGNNPTGANIITEDVGYLGFQMSYNLPIKQISRPIREHKTQRQFCDMQREVLVKKQFVVHSLVLPLELFDHENEDGDIVSVCFNGKYILEKHLLTNKPKLLDISLESDSKNILTIFANNTGKEGANTTALRFKINDKVEQIILYADKKSSEAIEFVYIP
ncbi:hypothetical protein [Flectobacillus major]|uniref:hypothetical protein n=1 Tax=Flectobacillus major TaxID=103 RepID=UPI0004048728|nr:hypothetical protein [Flectobacillus major]